MSKFLQLTCCWLHGINKNAKLSVANGSTQKCKLCIRFRIRSEKDASDPDSRDVNDDADLDWVIYPSDSGSNDAAESDSVM